jgi:hypothetical protein
METSQESKPIAQDDLTFASRVFEVMIEEMNGPERWHYLSFADSEFRGAVVVWARGATHALLRANELRANPGGEVLCVPIPEDKVPAEKFRDRLLGKAEIEEMWGEPCKTIREWDEAAQL